MEFSEITEESRVWPGEYIYHEPSRSIVIVGSFNRSQNRIQTIGNGRLIVDEIDNFRKINLTRAEHQKYITTKRCSGCKKK
mgnify:CR=1 FL=1